MSQVLPTPVDGGGGGGGGTPASTVVTEQAYGQASAVGTSTDFARADHTHGTPTAVVPVTAHSALTSVSLGWANSAHTGTTNSVACFSNTGAALNAQATVDGTVLSFTGGVLQFVAMAATVALVNSRNINVEYLPLNAEVLPSFDAIIVAGTVV